ncbi:PDZ domain-containing protein [bacterium]|nr:PDZ domain-containing protein [bacterium]
MPASAGEKKTKAFLGIVPAEVTSDFAADYGLSGPGTGVVVEDVVSDSPAEKIGLRENDVIVKINQAILTGPEELRTQLAKYKPGEKVDLIYLRGGKEKMVQVELSKTSEVCSIFHKKDWDCLKKGKGFHFEGPPRIVMKGAPWEWEIEDAKENVAFAGIVTQDLSEGLAGYFGVEEGALISEVVKDSPAEKAGLKAGDVITKIGDREVEDPGDVRRVIRKHEIGDEVDFHVYRDRSARAIKIKLGERK